jgi:hypothetical protein
MRQSQTSKLYSFAGCGAVVAARRFKLGQAASVLATCCLALLVLPGALVGGNIMIDEYGNAANDMGLNINSTLGQDIHPGGLPNALLFSVPVLTWTQGDVFLMEPPNGTEMSDVIRFNAAPYQIVFYSDVPQGEPNPPLADTGFPNVFDNNQVSVVETGIEGNYQGFYYTPVLGQPGFDPTHPNVTWHFVSETPEPSTLVLLGIGGISLLGIGWRRCKRST